MCLPPETKPHLTTPTPSHWKSMNSSWVELTFRSIPLGPVESRVSTFQLDWGILVPVSSTAPVA